MKADEYGIHINDFLKKYSAHDVTELMAVDNLKDPEYFKALDQEAKAETMTAEEQSAAIISLLGGKR